MFHVSFALFGHEDVIVAFGINKAVQAVLLCEAVSHAGSVFPGAPGKIRGCADIERAVGPVGHDVYPSALTHPRMNGKSRRRRWPRRWPEQARPWGPYRERQ